MKFKIHYELNEAWQSFEVSGDTIEDIQAEVKSFFEKRGLEPDKVNAYSEPIE